MPKKILCCGILEKELEHVLQGKEVEIHYLEPGLHVDFDKLEKALAQALDGLNEDSVAVGPNKFGGPEKPFCLVGKRKYGAVWFIPGRGNNCHQLVFIDRKFSGHNKKRGAGPPCCQ